MATTTDAERNRAATGEIPSTFKPPQFTDPFEAREFLKGRLALAFRIFAKHGFDDGVAGHITLRVRSNLEEMDLYTIRVWYCIRTQFTPHHSGSTPSGWHGTL